MNFQTEYPSKPLFNRIIVGIKCFIILLLVALACLNSSFFYGEYDTTTNFEASGYSNPITANAPLRIDFVASQPRLHQIQIEFVPSEKTTNKSILFSLYTIDGIRLQQTEMATDDIAAGQGHCSIPIEVKLDKNQAYYFMLESTTKNKAEAYRITLGSTETSDVQTWHWGNQQEVSSPNIHFIYWRLSRQYLVFFTGCLVVALAATLLPPLQKQWQKIAYHIFLALLSPLFLLYVTELLNFNTLQSLGLWAILLNYLLFLSLIILLYAASNRFSVAIIGTASILLLGAVINHFTLVFRKSVLIPTDLYGAGTAMDVLSGYRLSFSAPLLLALAVWVMLFYATLRNKVVLRGIRVRLVSAALAVLFTSGCAFTLTQQTLYERQGVTLDSFRQTTQSKQNGFYLNFGLNIPYLFNVAPNGYSAKNIPSLFSSEATSDTAAQTPHIIAIMNESLADLSVVGDPGATQDPLPFIHSLAQSPNAFVGNTVVPVYGGMTSCSEFEFLTGFSLAFGNASSAPLTQYVHQQTPSLAWQLSQLGYQTSASHPATGSNWDRAKTYPLLGFDKTVFLEGYQNAHYLRGLVSDASDYDELIAHFEQSRQNPQFVFNITIQNHGGYEVPDFEPSVQIANQQGRYPQTEQYLTLMRESDKAFEELIAYFEQVNEPVLVVMFGDHWGAIEEDYVETLFGKPLSNLTEGENLLQYQTPFIVWSNFNMDFSIVPKTVSLNYWGSLIKNLAGLPLTAYDQFLLQMMQQYPIISKQGVVDVAGNHFSASEILKVSQQMQNYEYVQYNGLVDHRRRYEQAFGYT